jgi:hypothetical protein
MLHEHRIAAVHRLLFQTEMYIVMGICNAKDDFTDKLHVSCSICSVFPVRQCIISYLHG